MTNFGKVSLVLLEVVQQRSTIAETHTKRGRCQTVRKYTKENGIRPDQKQIKYRKSKGGGEIAYVKIYNHEDSSEWSFSDKEEEAFDHIRSMDDGTLKVEDDQLAATFKATTQDFAGGDIQKGHRLTKTALRVAAEEKKQLKVVKREQHNSMGTQASKAGMESGDVIAAVDVDQELDARAQEEVEKQTPINVQRLGGL